MIWALLSLGSGVLASLQGAYSKKGLISGEFHDWTIMLVRFVYIFPIFVLFWIFEKMPLVVTEPLIFTMTIVALVVLEVVSQWTFHQSIKISALSLVLPFQNLTPIFIIPVNFFVFRELPSAIGFWGILISTAGLFLLFKNKPAVSSHKNFCKKKLGGIGLMVVTSILWAFTTTLQKAGIQFAGVSLFGVVYIGGVVAVMLGYHLARRISLAGLLKVQNSHLFLSIGFLSGFSTLLQYWALSLTNPAYVNALKRTGTITGIFWDRAFFRESIKAWSLVGNALVIVGTVLLVVS